MIFDTQVSPCAEPFGCERCGETFWVLGKERPEFCPACWVEEQRDRLRHKYQRRAANRARKRESARAIERGKPVWKPLPEPEPDCPGVLGALRLIERMGR